MFSGYRMSARTQLEEWVIEKLSPLKDERMVVLRDPQRLIRPDARAVDGWAAENHFNALLCSGNFRFRIWFEPKKEDTTVNLLLVDQTRDPEPSLKTYAPPLFYPDFLALTSHQARLRITLRDFLSHTTDDSRWPELINERNMSRLVLENLDGVLEAHQHLRDVDERFTDTDLYKIVLGAMLGINPFRNPTPMEVRRLCIEQHSRLDEVRQFLPEKVTEVLIKAIESAEAPFKWYLRFDHHLVTRAFTLSLILHQYDGLDHRLLLTNFDSSLGDLREIEPATLDQVGKEHLEAEPDHLSADVADLEQFIREDSAHVRLLFKDLLKIHDRNQAVKVLKTEKLSPMVRSMAMAALLADLLANMTVDRHKEVLDILDQEEAELETQMDLFETKQKEPLPLILRRPSEDWTRLKETYRLVHKTFALVNKAKKEAHQLLVAKPQDLFFERFDRAWRKDGLSKLDFYISDIARILRLDQTKPLPDRLLWNEFRNLWKKARERFDVLQDQVGKDMAKFEEKFQDLYSSHYTQWIQDDKAPVIFTHQFVPRFIKSHWDPRMGQKAYLLIFDGMRVEAWQEFLLPIFLERFEVLEERPGSAILPTETDLTRKAISAGCLPNQFISKRESDLLEAAVKKHIGYNLKLQVEKDDDDAATGIVVRYTSPLLKVVIFGFSDKNLHNNMQDLAFIYRKTVRAIIEEDVRSVLGQIEDDAVIFVTSDHGFMPTGKRRFRISENDVANHRDVNHLNARLQQEIVGRERQAMVQFPAAHLGIPTQTKGGQGFAHLAFPRPGFTFQRPKHGRDPDKYTHGGLSPAECLIPVVCLGPKRERSLPLQIEGLSVQGSLMESEEVTLLLTLAGSAHDLKLQLDVVDAERTLVQDRTELFHRDQQTYRLPWSLPMVEKPTTEEMEAAAAERTVTVTVRYRYGGKNHRTSKTLDVRILLDRHRLRRPGTSKLDAVLGMMPRKVRQ